MEVQAIFQKLSKESPILNKLKNEQNLVFVGDRLTLNYLKSFFDNDAQSANYTYYSLAESQLDKQKLLECKAVIVASTIDENVIYFRTKLHIQNLAINVPVLKLFADIFINFKCGQDLLQPADLNMTIPDIAYAIVSTPRSGSTAICSILNSTGIAGYPKEHLRHDSEIITQHCNFDYIRYLKILMSRHVTKNNVFGTKFISHFLQEHTKSKFDLKQISNQFKWIYLERQDKQKQAVSLFIAQTSNLWHATSKNKYNDYTSSIDTLDINESKYLEKIHGLYKYLVEQEKYIVSFFDRYSLSPLSIKYEDFAESNEKCLTEILNYLNISNIENVSLSSAKVNTRKLKSNLAKELTEKYKERYFSCI